MSLRPYQIDCNDAILTAWRGGENRLLASMPTGTGKAVTLAELIRQLMSIERAQALVLAHREEIVDQLAATIRRRNPRMTVGIERAQDKCDPATTDIIVGSVETMGRATEAGAGRWNYCDRLAKFDRNRVKYILPDECHRAVAPSFQHIFRYFKCLKSDPATNDPAKLLVGWTATPQRGDNVGLEEIFDRMVFWRDIRTMIDDGWLCFDEETELLTTDGWKSSDKIQLSDTLISLVPGAARGYHGREIYHSPTHTLGYFPIKQIIKKRATTGMVRFAGSSIDAYVTDDHRMLYKNHVPRMADGRVQPHFLLKEAGQLARLGRGYIALPISGDLEKTDWDITDAQLRLTGWIMTDGHLGKRPIEIAQNAGPKLEGIKALLASEGIRYSVHLKHKKGRRITFGEKTYFATADHYVINVSLGQSRKFRFATKEVPRDFLAHLSRRQVLVFLDALIDGDGTRPKHRSGHCGRLFYTNRKSVVDALQALCVTRGIACTYKQKACDYEYYCMSFSDRKLTHVRPAVNIKQEHDARPRVWCVSSDSGTVISRRNGRVLIAGNCPVKAYRVDTGIDISAIKSRGGDFIIKELERAVNVGKRNELILQKYLEMGDKMGFFCFTVDVQHSEDMAALFRRNGIEAYPVSYKTPKQERRELINAMRERKIDGLCSCAALTEGTDVPSASVALMTRPTKSALLYTQSLGRVLRPYPSPEDMAGMAFLAEKPAWVKPYAVVLDFVDVCGKHRISGVPTLFGLRQDYKFDKQKTVTEELNEIDEMAKKAKGIDLTKYSNVIEMRAAVEAIDLFAVPSVPEAVQQYSKLAWTAAFSGGYNLHLPERLSFALRQNALGQWDVYRTVKGVREFMRTLPNIGLAFQMADNLVPQDKIGVVLAKAKWRNQEASPEQIKTLAKYRKDMRAKFPDYKDFTAWVKKTYTKGDVSRLLDEVFGKRRRA